MKAGTLRSVVLGAACAVSLALAGCVVAPAPYAPYGYYGEPVTMAPPPPQQEYAPPPPVIGWIWLGGYWTWRANRHVWIGGHWEAPRPGHRYVPHEWRQDGRGWHERPGRWDRR